MDKKLQYPLLPATVIPFLCSNKGCKDFYETLNRNNEKPTSQNKWINIYDIEENTWPEIYSSQFHQKLSSTMQWFQFRINHRLLPTKKYLHTIKACQSPLCTFCQEEETITHMLWSCPESQALINEFRRWLQSFSINLRIIEELYIKLKNKSQLKIRLWNLLQSNGKMLASLTMATDDVNFGKLVFFFCFFCVLPPAGTRIWNIFSLFFFNMYLFCCFI